MPTARVLVPLIGRPAVEVDRGPSSRARGLLGIEAAVDSVDGDRSEEHTRIDVDAGPGLQRFDDADVGRLLGAQVTWEPIDRVAVHARGTTSLPWFESPGSRRSGRSG